MSRSNTCRKSHFVRKIHPATIIVIKKAHPMFVSSGSLFCAGVVNQYSLLVNQYSWMVDFTSSLL